MRYENGARYERNVEHNRRSPFTSAPGIMKFARSPDLETCMAYTREKDKTIMGISRFLRNHDDVRQESQHPYDPLESWQTIPMNL